STYNIYTYRLDMSKEEIFEDWYSVLELEHDATEKQIQRAYRVLSVKWHPDKNKSAEARVMFEKISEAKKILNDKEKRALFDAQIKAKREKKRKDDEMDRKRKKMKDDLNTREEEIRRKKQRELDEKQRDRDKYRDEVLRSMSRFGAAQQQQQSRTESSSSTIDTKSVVLVRWRSKLKYGEDGLTDVFSSYGQVDSIVILEDDECGEKRRRKCNAIVYFTSNKTVDSIIGQSKEIKSKFKLKVERATTASSPPSHVPSGTENNNEDVLQNITNITEPTTTPTNNTSTNTPTTTSQSFKEKENDVLRRLRERIAAKSKVGSDETST
ncbi:hypothetical protein SAMD00019534_111950, partial [Acytostelium subglobosum LB1]|uniref:hypothetical protein n=1 Tax=Acytostelium subglobosum LB1 TaxID=1410327 RepID=UPI000644B702